MRWWRAGLLLLMFARPAWAASPPPYVVGTWFGEGEPSDKYEMYLDHLMPDGTFRGEYRSCVKGKGSDTSQSGNWALSGDTLTLTILNVDGQFDPRIDVYKTLSHTAQKWTYRFIPSGFAFDAKRVDGKFEMPDCQAIS